MSGASKIEWTDATFNPWIGCTKVAPECDNCYAETQDKFRSWTPDGWGAGKPRRLTKTWGEPLKWDRAAGEAGERRRVFCASLADVFDGEVDDQWRRDLFELIAKTENLDWLLLTKRPSNAARFLRELKWKPWPWVWLGISVGTKARVSQIDALRRIPAAVRFLSCEPLLEDLGTLDLTGIHWVIVGGESGANARPMHPDWVRSIRDQCIAAGVGFFFKQWGEWLPGGQQLSAPVVLHTKATATIGGQPFVRVGKKAAGRILDERTWEESPTQTEEQ